MLREFWRRPVVLVSAGVIALGSIIILLLVVFRPHSPIPDSIAKQLNFSVFYPDMGEEFKADPATINYDGSSKVLLFHVKSAKNDITLTQQATPDPINDIPEYYPKLMEKLNNYKDFDSVNGKVSLTRPIELKGGQSAVFNIKGTLMFAHPEHDMSDDEWRRFFNGLVLTLTRH